MQKINEKEVFNIFSDLCTDIPAGNISFPDRPDVLIGDLGIEQTEVFIHEKIQEHWYLQQCVVDEAYEKLKEEINPLRVTVFFNSDFPIDVKRLSKELADLIKNSLGSSQAENAHIGGNVKIIDTTDVPQIVSINIRQNVIENRWMAAKYGEAANENFFVEKLQDCIGQKNEKHKHYLKKCKECWLLISYFHQIPSQMFHLSSEPFNGVIICSPFKKIFLLELANKRLYRLKS